MVPAGRAGTGGETRVRRRWVRRPRWGGEIDRHQPGGDGRQPGCQKYHGQGGRVPRAGRGTDVREVGEDQKEGPSSRVTPFPVSRLGTPQTRGQQAKYGGA